MRSLKAVALKDAEDTPIEGAWAPDHAAILVVDNDPRELFALTSILEPLADEVVPAASGTEALALVLTRPSFALILLEVRMPDTDGHSIASLVWRHPRGRGVPIVFVTGRDDQRASAAEAIARGAAGWLVKPIDPDLLRAIANMHVEKHRRASRAGGASA